MRIHLILLGVFLIIIGCDVSIETTLPGDKEKTKDIINTTMDNWHQAAAKADLKNYIGAMDSGAIYIGTDATENWTREEFATFCKPYFDKKTTWNFTPLKRNIYLSTDGNVAWFDELLKTHMGTCRGSGTLEFREDTWKIQHYVLSMAIPNDAIEGVKTAKKVLDDTFLKTFE